MTVHVKELRASSAWIPSLRGVDTVAVGVGAHDVRRHRVRSGAFWTT